MRRVFDKNRGVCVIEGCGRPRRNKGWQCGKKIFGKHCDYHHKLKYGLKNGVLREEYIPNKKCILCGWEGPCDRHRINNNIGYFKENVRVICPNCHRLVTLGIIEIS